jgi:hypothetical protein
VVVKLQLGLPATVSGGSWVSWSEICAPVSVTVQVSFGAKSASGLSRKLVPSPVTTAECDPLVVHEIEYHGSVTVTGSLKVMPMFASNATPVASAAGVWLVTAGARSVEPGSTSKE